MNTMSEDVINTCIHKSKLVSPKALKYFLPHVYCQNKQEKQEMLVMHQETKIKKHLCNQLELPYNSWLKFDGWKQVIEDNDKDDLYSDQDEFNLCHQCKYLYFGISLMLQH